MMIRVWGNVKFESRCDRTVLEEHLDVWLSRLTFKCSSNTVLWQPSALSTWCYVVGFVAALQNVQISVLIFVLLGWQRCDCCSMLVPFTGLALSCASFCLLFGFSELFVCWGVLFCFFFWGGGGVSTEKRGIFMESSLDDVMSVSWGCLTAAFTLLMIAGSLVTFLQVILWAKVSSSCSVVPELASEGQWGLKGLSCCMNHRRFVLFFFFHYYY